MLELIQTKSNESIELEYTYRNGWIDASQVDDGAVVDEVLALEHEQLAARRGGCGRRQSLAIFC